MDPKPSWRVTANVFIKQRGVLAGSQLQPVNLCLTNFDDFGILRFHRSRFGLGKYISEKMRITNCLLYCPLCCLLNCPLHCLLYCPLYCLLYCLLFFLLPRGRLPIVLPIALGGYLLYCLLLTYFIFHILDYILRTSCYVLHISYPTPPHPPPKPSNVLNQANHPSRPGPRPGS